MRYKSRNFVFLLVLLSAVFHPPSLADTKNEIQQEIEKVYDLSADDSKATLVKIDAIRHQYQNRLTPEHQAQLIGMEAVYHTYSNDYQLALDTIEKINQLPKPKVNSFNWRINTVKGYIYWHMGEGQLALQHYLQSYEQIKNQALYEYEKVTTELMIGEASMELGFYREALPYFERVVDHTQEKGSLRQLSMAYNFLGEALFKLEQIDRAFDYHQQALKIRLEQNMRFHSALSYHNLGLVHHHRKDYAQARQHFLTAITIRRENGDPLGVLQIQLALAKVHMATGQKQDLAALLSKIVDNAKAQQKFSPLADAYHLQSEFFESQSQYSQALAAFKQYQQTLEKVELKKTSSHLAKYITQSTTVAKDINILQLQKINEIQQIEVRNQQQKAVIIIVAAAIIIFVLTLFLWLLQQKRCKIQNINRHLSDTLKDLKETQVKLIQSEKMASLGVLTAGVAHEINNPNNFIHVSAQNIDTLMDGTARIKRIVQDLRKFVQLDCAEQKMFSLVEGLESVINLTKSKPFSTVEIETLFEDIPDILCFPAQLNQVFMHLINNAYEAIVIRQQSVDKTIGKIIIGCNRINNMIEIYVQDNGCGIDEMTQTRLFEPFFTTKDPGQGTGLGLSVSFGIINNHRGVLAVDSEPGVGSRFCISLPLTK